MAAEKLLQPPPRLPIREFSTPSLGDGFYTERVDYSSPDYREIERGAKYANQVGANPDVIAQFSDLFFLKEIRDARTYPLATRIWATDRLSEDTYNSSVEYVAEAVAFPAFTRVYMVRRDGYDAAPSKQIGQPLDSLVAIQIIDPGKGYTRVEFQLTPENDDVEIEPIIDKANGGTLIAGIIRNQGSGFEVAPAITIVGDGGDARAIAIIQPQSAVLVQQKKSELPDDHPLRNEYVLVTRVYETLPGPTLNTTRIDDDGVVVNVATTRKVAATITSGETINTGVWTKTTKRQSDNLYVGEEVVETRTIPGNDLVKTVIDANGDIMTETRTMVVGPPTLVTTNVILAGVWTKTFGEPISDLVSWRVVQVRSTQNSLDSFEVSIPDLVPPEFRGVAPLTTTESTEIGTASLPALATGDIRRKQEQIDAYTYRLTISGRAGLVLPITLTDKETTTQFGGGDLDVVMTLHYVGSLGLEEGLTIVSSEIKNLGNGLILRTTRKLHSGSWPPLPSRLWDENMRLEYDETQQVVATGSSEDANPDPYPSGTIFAWISEVKAIDEWKAKKINISKPAPAYLDQASALITYDFRPYKFPGLLTTATFGYYVRESYAQQVRNTIRTWWQISVGPPTVTIDDIITDNIVISTLNDITTLAYSGEVLHDDITTFGTLFWPATTPSYTDYIASWQGVEKAIAVQIIPEREPNVWKIQLRSVIMR